MFWGTVEAIQQGLGSVFTFQSWLQGCPCHETLVLEQNERVTCPWKGCRGPEVGDKVREVSQDLWLHSKRSVREGHDVDGPEGLELRAHEISNKVMLLWDLKMAFVNDLPFYIWQACWARAW